MYGDPVGAAGGEAVGEGAAVLREAAAGERHRAVRRQRVRVQEHTRLALQAVLYVQHTGRHELFSNNHLGTVEK